MVLLSENEVRSIFRYIHGEESECKLDFKIIHSRADVCGVGTKTRALKGKTLYARSPLNLSSCSHSIRLVVAEGIYLLCDTQREDFPSHLRDVVGDESSNSRAMLALGRVGWTAYE